MKTYEGGCQCGLIRYRVIGEPFDSDYCHCEDCRKSSGAPVMVWFDIKAEQLTWLGALPKEYVSSANIRRGFCPECGTTLSYRSTAYPDYVTLSTASLDTPNAIAPKYHIFTANSPNWLAIDDALPRHLGPRR